jgi:chorismate mutase
MGIVVRGVRGAITVDHDDSDEIISAAGKLLETIITANDINEEMVASVIFTTTPDLTAAYPAKAARQIGWTRVALMGCQEMENPAGLSRCIRVLIHWNTDKSLDELRHIYLRDAVVLRPDITKHESRMVNGGSGE